jgi:DNA-binding MarR family transcriptional regulator
MLQKDRDPEELTIGQLLGQVCKLVGGRMRVRMEEIGLHRAQGLILSHLWGQDNVPQKDLARALHITPATVTNTLQRMERDGWVRRQRDTGDHRIVRVELTKGARALQGEVMGSLGELDREINGALTEGEEVALRGCLLKIHRHLAAAAPEHASGSPASGEEVR